MPLVLLREAMITRRGLDMTNADKTGFLAGVFAGVVRAAWVFLVLAWTPLKWVFSVEVFYRLIVALYHWDTPGSTAGWTFIAHFVVLTGLTYFVSIYKPKNT